VPEHLPLAKKLVVLWFLSRKKIVSYSVELHRYLSTVRDQSLYLFEGYVDQFAHYSCGATSHAFANQVI
jgi:hypothetical protein